MSLTLVPHFAFPFQMVGDHFGVREQDSLDEISDCVAVLLLTPVGTRFDLPQYGAPEVLFTQAPFDQGPLAAAIERWEPRATVVMSEILDSVDSKIAHIVTDVSPSGALTS